MTTETSPPPATLRSLLGYLGEHRGTLAVVVALSIVAAGLTLAQPVVVNQVITSVSDASPLGPLVATLTALVLASAAVGAGQMYLLERTAEAVVLSSRRRLISHLLRLPIRVFDTRNAGDLVSRVGSDTTVVRAALTGGLADSVGSALVFIGALIAMILLDPVLLGITAAVVAIAVAAVVIASGHIEKLTVSAQESVGRLGTGVVRAVSAVRTIRAAGATEREEARLLGDADAAYGFSVRIAKVGAVLWPVSGLALQGSFLAVLGVGGYRVAAGLLSIADLVTFILFLFLMIMPLGSFFSAITTVRVALGGLARIDEVLNLPAEQDSDPAFDQTDTRPGHAALHPDAGVRPMIGLAYESVTFGYEPGSPVLDQVSFCVPQGKTTALVGPSGAGKSTLLALAERFYDPDAGAVLLDGVDIRTLPRADLRARLGYVEQSGGILSGTIRDNLLLAAPGASDQASWAALGTVNLLDRVRANPDGLDARLGDDGIGLSGGERQRLAIARVLLADAPLLLLDEPTASLDSHNEQAFHAALRTASRGRTVLIVAHRLATVASADQIVVLETGRVVGVGTHPELLATSDLYRSLAQYQLLA